MITHGSGGKRLTGYALEGIIFSSTAAIRIDAEAAIHGDPCPLISLNARSGHLSLTYPITTPSTHSCPLLPALAAQFKLVYRGSRIGVMRLLPSGSEGLFQHVLFCPMGCYGAVGLKRRRCERAVTV